MTERVFQPTQIDNLLLAAREVKSRPNIRPEKNSLIKSLNRNRLYINLPEIPASLRQLTLGINPKPDAPKLLPQARPDDEHVGNRTGNSASPDILPIYLKEISKRPLLTKAQEVDLAKKYESGRAANDQLSLQPDLSAQEKLQLEAEAARGEEAQGVLVESNLRLVVSIARRYKDRGVPFTDLIQEGSIGLIRATEKFDYRRGFRFSTYATWWIRQAVTRAVSNDANTIRKPVHFGEKAVEMYRAYTELAQKLQAEPTHEQLAEQMNTTPEKITASIRAYSTPTSLEAFINTDEDATVGDFVVDPEAETAIHTNANQREMRDKLEQAFEDARLNKREQLVLKLRFGIGEDEYPRTLEEVGKELGVTRERARQMEVKALRKLRPPAVRSGLAELMH